MTGPLDEFDVVRAALRRLNPDFHENDSAWTALNRIEGYMDEYQRLWHRDADERSRLKGALAAIRQYGNPGDWFYDLAAEALDQSAATVGDKP